MKTRVLPLAAWVFAVFVVWWILHHSDIGPDDTVILLGIGFVYTVAIFVMLWGTEVWTVRGVGLFGTVLADVGLYGRSGMARAGWMPPLAPWETDLIRSLFLCGAPLLLWGLIRWVLDQRRHDTAEKGTIPP